MPTSEYAVNIPLAFVDDDKNKIGTSYRTIKVKGKEFKTLTDEDIGKMFANTDDSKNIIVDVKGVRSKDELKTLGYRYWRL